MPDEQPLVFAARRAPWPLDNGGRIRAHNLLAGLARAFPTTLVYVDHAEGSPDGHVAAGELRAALPGVDVVPVAGEGPGKRLAQLTQMPRRASFSWGRYATPALRAAIGDTAARTGARIVHFDDLGSALTGRVPGALNAYSSHNIEARIAQLDGAAAGSLQRRLYHRVEAAKLRREELGVWRGMDLTLAVSPVDAEVMRNAGARRVELCPNGTAPAGPLPPAAAPGPGEPLRVLFVGSGAYTPYERGLAWFVTEVMPRLRERGPTCFDVVGQPPNRPVEADGVVYHGRVPAVEPHYAAAHVVVIPVFEGSGTRLKMVEAAAYGRPVVSTTLGAEGLPLRAPDHYACADTPEAFAAAVAELGAGSPPGMLERARAAIEPLFWPRIAAELAALYAAEAP